MASVSVLLPGSTPPEKHRKVTIVTADGRRTLVVPLLREVGLSDVASRWAIQDRPGRHPVTTHGGDTAPKASVDMRFGGDDLATSCETALATMRNIARGSSPVVISVGQLTSWSSTGTWAITGMTVTVTARVQGSNDAARADVTLELTAALTPEQLRGA